MDIELHYAKFDLDDVCLHTIPSKKLLFDTVKDIITINSENKELVYLIAFENSFNSLDDVRLPIIVEDFPMSCIDLLYSVIFGRSVDRVFLQEYTCFEDAYEVALQMREPNILHSDGDPRVIRE